MSEYSIGHIVGLPCAIAASIILAGTGCSGPSKSTPVVYDTHVDAVHSHEYARVAKGKTLTVQLPTSTRTVYGWRLASEPSNHSNLRLNERLAQQNIDGGLAFADDPAADVFTFKAAKPGITTLEFVYDAPPGVPQSACLRRTVEIEVFDPVVEFESLAVAESSDLSQ